MMAITPEQIDVWRAAPSESEHLEFKEAKLNLDTDTICEYAVALANEGGGHLLLGIHNKPPRAVVGSHAFPKIGEISHRVHQKIGIRVDFEEVMHPDGRVVAISIPSRPRGVPLHFNGRYLMRVGESLVAMTGDRLHAIFNEDRPDWLEEPGSFVVDAQAVIDQLDTQAFFELMQVPYPTTRDGVIERLLGERLIDRRSGGFTIRRLGALLLAKRLNSFPDVRRKAMRVIVYAGDSKLDTKLDEIASRGIAVGFAALIDFVMAQLPQNEVVAHALRERVTLVPEVVVRELAANALVHQDFAITGASPTIEIYANRVEFSNPGKPGVATDRFIDDYRSRNDRLADLMRRMRICEEKGSGVDRVVHNAEAFQLPAPLFRENVERTVVSIFGVRPFEDMDRDDRVRACYQHCSLRWVTDQRMTNQSLRERFNLPDSRASVSSQIIAATIEQGLIKLDEAVGASRKYARYLPYWA
ncbi:ATP-binding protein [Sphingomonas sp. RB3P16]|uniref:ATP-binding protein n=1 Tax=Parasphingomonas frigoris TaxID=3096163 RepID=UPI002FC8BB8E